MKTYKCPSCTQRMTCLGQVEGHFCPGNKSKWVPGNKWILIEPPSKEG